MEWRDVSHLSDATDGSDGSDKWVPDVLNTPEDVLDRCGDQRQDLY